jgi:hypothetical protein
MSDGAAVGYATADGLSVNDAVIRDLTTQIRLVLTDDTWADDLGSGNSTGLQDLVNHLFSVYRAPLLPPTTLVTWESALYALISPSSDGASADAVQRIDARTVVITIPPTPSYVLQTDETISVSIPASATSSRRDYDAAGRFIIRATSAEVVVTQTATTATTSTAMLDEEILRRPNLPGDTKQVRFTLGMNQGRFWNTGLQVPTYVGAPASCKTSLLCRTSRSAGTPSWRHACVQMSISDSSRTRWMATWTGTAGRSRLCWTHTRTTTSRLPRRSV